MLKRIKNLYKKSVVSNERGSAMSVALIVITILTFSMTTMTNISVNLAGSTTHKITQVNEENYAKGLIKQAIAEFEVYIDSVAALDTVIANITDYGVVVTDESDNIVYDPLDVFGTGAGGHESRIFKFAYTMADGDVLVMFAYVSNGGSASASLNPFDFSMGTNESLIMNGGYYDEIWLYGQEVYLASVAPFVQSGTTTQHVTPISSAIYPVLTPAATASVIYATDLFEVCETGSTCYTTNVSANPFIINESNFIDVASSSIPDQGEMATETIYDFFGSYDYDEDAIDYIQNDAPTDSRTITDAMTLATSGAVVLANSDVITYKPNGQPNKPIPTTPFINITTDTNWDFSEDHNFKDFSPFVIGNVTLNYDVLLKSNESMFIDGDLTIDNQSGLNLSLEGTFVVTGDLYFTGNSVDIEGTFWVFGETYMNFADDEGIVSFGNNAGLSIIAKDNIIIEEIFVSHVNATAPALFSAFFYTEESIYIDAVNSKFHMEGALYARGLGVSGNQIFLNDEVAAPMLGIIINSYRGYINGSGVAVPTTPDSNNRFRIEKVAQSNFQDKFQNIPTFETLITDIDNWTFDTSEFSLE